MYPDFSGPFVIRTRPELRLDTPGSQRWAQNDLCFVNGFQTEGFHPSTQYGRAAQNHIQHMSNGDFTTFRHCPPQFVDCHVTTAHSASTFAASIPDVESVNGMRAGAGVSRLGEGCSACYHCSAAVNINALQSDCSPSPGFPQANPFQPWHDGYYEENVRTPDSYSTSSSDNLDRQFLGLQITNVSFSRYTSHPFTSDNQNNMSRHTGFRAINHPPETYPSPAEEPATTPAESIMPTPLPSIEQHDLLFKERRAYQADLNQQVPATLPAITSTSPFMRLDGNMSPSLTLPPISTISSSFRHDRAITISPFARINTTMPATIVPRTISPARHGPVGNTPAPFYEGPLEGGDLPFTTFSMSSVLAAENGNQLFAKIFATPVKGLTKEHDDWISYRRNYLSTSCAYSLTPACPGQKIYVEEDGQRRQVQALSIKLSAAMDRGAGKQVSLVKSNAKRDKTSEVLFDKLYPKSHSGIASSLPISQCPLLPLQNLNDESCERVPFGDNGRYDATFDRTMFTAATQNNGRKRSGHQQYYHLVVGLYADIRPEGGAVAHWVKVAQQVSDPVIVRGRSPKHYRGKSASSSKRSDPSSDGGKKPPPSSDGGFGPSEDGRGSYDQPGNVSGSSAHKSEGAYPSSGSYYMAGQHYGNDEYPPLSRPTYSFSKPGGQHMTKEEADRYDNHDGYLYYPSSSTYPPRTIGEDHDARPNAYPLLTSMYPPRTVRVGDMAPPTAHFHPSHRSSYDLQDEHTGDIATPADSPYYVFSGQPESQSPENVYNGGYPVAGPSSYHDNSTYAQDLVPLAYVPASSYPDESNYTWVPAPPEHANVLPMPYYTTPRQMPSFDGDFGQYRATDTSRGHYQHFDTPQS